MSKRNCESLDNCMLDLSSNYNSVVKTQEYIIINRPGVNSLSPI